MRNGSVVGSVVSRSSHTSRTAGSSSASPEISVIRNHVLPTKGAARYTGGLWVGKYLKSVTYQEVTDCASSAALGELCGRAARVELFEGHARSGDVRVAKYTGAPFSWSEHAPGTHHPGPGTRRVAVEFPPLHR